MKQSHTFYFLLASSVIAGVLLTGCNETQSTLPVTPQDVTPPTQTTTTPIDNPQAVTTQTPPPSTVTVTAQTYKDGTYSESSSYDAPPGLENITFAFTLEKDTIKNVEITSKSSHPVSVAYQDKFLSGIKEQIIGKKLDQVGSFDRVNGSSLTGEAFNAALAKLKTESKA